nr:uncharacterized protein LOC109750075 [Aegilops tauschii subsp. strangulata]
MGLEDQVGRALEGRGQYHLEGLDLPWHSEVLWIRMSLEDQVGGALEGGGQYHLEGLDLWVTLAF